MVEETEQEAAAPHPFDWDPADDCETSLAAYRDIAPLLGKLAQKLKKSKVGACGCVRVCVCVWMGRGWEGDSGGIHSSALGSVRWVGLRSQVVLRTVRRRVCSYDMPTDTRSIVITSPRSPPPAPPPQLHQARLEPLQPQALQPARRLLPARCRVAPGSGLGLRSGVG